MLLCVSRRLFTEFCGLFFAFFERNNLGKTVVSTFERVGIDWQYNKVFSAYMEFLQVLPKSLISSVH